MAEADLVADPAAAAEAAAAETGTTAIRIMDHLVDHQGVAEAVAITRQETGMQDKTVGTKRHTESSYPISQKQRTTEHGRPNYV